MTRAEQDYKRKLYAIRDLPTLPVIAQKILTLADDDDTGAEKLSQIIKSDQSLAVKVLSLANSAYFGYRARIGTIHQAVAVIGTNMLKQLAISAIVCGAVDRNPHSRIQFWRHSLLTALTASHIAAKAGVPGAEVCFMGGLLHDIGKLILNTYPAADGAIDHTEVGGWMAERWQLPRELADAIAFHHSSDYESMPTARTIACVSLGNACAHIAAADNQQAHAVEVHPATLKVLGFDEAHFIDVAATMRDRIGQIDEFLI
jgi:putative nucleotidyltransferase with HDIG domain